ncbi:MAG: hypothetical protein R3E44_15625 [Paracoccaceae bacterium]
MNTKILALALVIAPAGAALAQGGSNFATVDADGNGQISMKEMEAAYKNIMVADFVRIDTNEDYLIDEGEYMQALEQNIIDQNGTVTSGGQSN